MQTCQHGLTSTGEGDMCFKRYSVTMECHIMGDAVLAELSGAAGSC
jgi:hypothetical protein